MTSFLRRLFLISCYFAKGGEFYEESSWIYSFSAPQDQIKLIELMGGPEQYVKRLDHYFDKGYHDMGDEPGKFYHWCHHYHIRQA